MRRLLPWAVGVTLALSALPAEAQQPAPEIACKDRRGAKREFNKGRLAYRRGDYEEAIVNWQSSYSLCEEPLIHLNIANAYERLGDLKSALAGLKKWREQAPRREHAELDARIESLQARIAEQDKKEAEARAAEERRRQEEAARLQQQQQPGAPKPTTTPQKSRTFDIVGWTLVGVGGAAVIAGVIMDAVAGSSRPAEDEACTDVDGRLLCRDAQRDDIEASNTLAIAGDVTWIAGAAIAGTGAIVLILSATGVIGKPKPTTGLVVPHAIVSEQGVSGAGVTITAPF